MQPVRNFDHIAGLTGREPVGAALTIGIKGPSGAPTNTDRFYFVLPHDEKRGEITVRPLHPSFSAYNDAEPKKRQMLRGNLVHANRAECFRHHLKAQVLPKPWLAHPNKRPACLGDGAVAVRYHGTGKDGVDDFREMVCPNDLCEFRQGDRKVCKPFAQLLFRPRWPDGVALPQPLTKLTTGSWNSTSALLGFFGYVESQARELGVENPSLYGLPFSLTLSRKTMPKRGAAFPVLSLSPDCDLIAFFLRQRADMAQLAASNRLALPPATLTDPDLEDPDVLASDSESIAPSKPASVTTEPIKAEIVEDPASDEPALLSSERVASLSRLATERGLDADLIAADVCGSGLAGAPASFDAQIMREIERRSAKKGGRA